MHIKHHWQMIKFWKWEYQWNQTSHRQFVIPHAFTRIESTRVGHFDMKFVICCDRLVLVDKKEESIEYSDVANRKCKSEWLSWLQRNQTPYLQVLRVSQLVLCCCVSVYGERKKKKQILPTNQTLTGCIYVWAVWQCVGETPKSKKTKQKKTRFWLFSASNVSTHFLKIWRRLWL